MTGPFGRGAKEHRHSIVTADADFVVLSQLRFPPKAIHLEQCDFPYRVIEDLLRRTAVRIAEFEKDQTTGVLSLRISPGNDLR